MAERLQVENLIKRYDGVEAVRGVSFSVAEGEIFGLLGPNGAGKTSTIECIVGLRTPDAGSISVCGIDAKSNPESARERLGVALQSTSLQDKITPREALKLFGSFYKHEVAAETLIERFTLGEKADSPFMALSHGQRQRLALALAFVNDPTLVFLDEPTTGLDPQSRRDVYALIQRMREEGRTVVLTTHYLEEAEALCDRVAIIDHGRVIAGGKPSELIANSRAMPRIDVNGSRPVDADRFRALPSIADARMNDGVLRLKTANVSQAIIDVVSELKTAGIELIDLKIHQPSLEDVFIELTNSNSA